CYCAAGHRPAPSCPTRRSSDLVPWALLPLVRGCRGGSPLGAVARSGLVVVLMGGVNAVSTLAALIVPFLYLLTRSPGPRRRAMVDRKSTRLNSSHVKISYAVFC